MLSRLVGPVARTAQRGTRNYHGHGDFKWPSMDECPVPQGSWKELHDKRQRRYNTQLFAGIALFATVLIVGETSGAFFFNSGPPKGVDFPYNDYSKK